MHAPWSMALAARLRDTLSLEAQSLWSDDGIALHLPEADAPPALADLLVEPDEVEELVVQEVGQTALFGARFRENAARALLIPRRRPGQRTPLWQQRLKAQSLLEVARPYGSFPIVLETYRECLQDVFDLPALRGILRGLATRELDLVEVETSSASPMAASLMFDYVATYMYADDTPAAERRAQALSLDRELLRELLGQEELRDLIDPGALADVEGSLRPVPRNADELHDLLRRGRRPPRRRARRRLRGDPRPRAARVPRARRRGRRGDRGRGRGPLSRRVRRDAARRVPGELPRAGRRRARARAAPLRPLARPVHHRRRRARYGLEPDAVELLLAALETRDLLVRGELRPGGVEREWCDPDVLRRIRRASLAVLRREVEPAEQVALGRFLPAWHGIDRKATLREALVPLQGLAIPVSLWETEILPRRVPGYQPASLDQLCASGEVVWVGAGLDRVALYYREDAHVLGPPSTGEPLTGPVHDTIRAALARSAEFWPDLLTATGLEAGEALPVLWELVWAGEATNDAWAPLRAKRRYGVPSIERRPRRFSRSRGTAQVATAGRWSLTARLFATGDAESRAPDRRALAELLLERQGIVTRDGVRAEGIAGGYGAVYGELKALETVGACRRGYFVEGLGGAQFALPGAVERLRELRRVEDDEPLVLAAADPAQPYGGVLPWPKRAGARAARVAGAHVVLLGGEAGLYVERGGRSLLPLREPDPEWLRPAVAALVDWVRADRGRRLSVERFDGRPVVESDVLHLLVEAGFLAGPKRAVLRP